MPLLLYIVAVEFCSDVILSWSQLRLFFPQKTEDMKTLKLEMEERAGKRLVDWEKLQKHSNL